MAAHFFDIDGTLVNYHTAEWLPGAKEYVLNMFKVGHKIILFTIRGEQDYGTNTKKTILKDLDDMGIKYTILFGVDSPRVIHDDSHIYVDQRETNQSWSDDRICM